MTPDPLAARVHALIAQVIKCFQEVPAIGLGDGKFYRTCLDEVAVQFIEQAPAALAAALEQADLTDLAAHPESYATVVDHYREMARRFAESRDELKHKCRSLEAALAAALAPNPEEK